MDWIITSCLLHQGNTLSRLPLQPSFKINARAVEMGEFQGVRLSAACPAWRYRRWKRQGVTFLQAGGQEVSTTLEVFILPWGQVCRLFQQPFACQAGQWYQCNLLHLQRWCSLRQHLAAHWRGQGKFPSNGPRCGSNQSLTSGLWTEQKFRTRTSAPWRALWFLTGLLVSGQRLVNRCQRPEKELPSLPAAGILAGVPAAELRGPGGVTYRSGMRRAGGVASLTFALPCFSRVQNKGTSGSKSDNVLISQGEKENKKKRGGSDRWVVREEFFGFPS